ncbi:MAG: hypothetical protein FWE14_01300 [Lachnospiraceae bacterium]|nr:hypothetical protein [Lachnospiraceae bacterium]
MKNKIGKIIFNIFYWLFFLGLGVLWGWQGWLNDWRGIISLIGLTVFFVLSLEAVNKKFWPKQALENNETAVIKEPWAKIIIRTALQVTMGGTFTFGLICTIFALIDGNNEDIFIYIGCMVVSIIILAVLIMVRPIQDQQAKYEIDKAKKDFKNIGKDERLKAIQHKAGYITLGVTLILLLVFGALITVFPPANYNLITMGILSIFGIAVALFTVLHGLYDAEKLDITKQSTIGGKTIVFLISLIPPALLAAQWIIAGLSNIGIAFFVVFVCVTINNAFDLWHMCKYK